MFFPLAGDSMFLSRHIIHLSAVLAVVALTACDIEAFPTIKGGGQHRNNSKSKNQGGPIDAAIKDLKQADKDLESKNNSNASQMTRAAEQIVSAFAQQAHDRGAGKERTKALDAALKDIHSAQKHFAAKKTDEASTSIKSAISGLEGLVNQEKKK